MKSKLFTHKFFVVLCISVAALLGLSFLARATIVNNRFEQMAVDEKYSLKASVDGQFLIQFQDDENGNFYATVGTFKITHIFNDSENGNIHHLGHFYRLADNH